MELESKSNNGQRQLECIGQKEAGGLTRRTLLTRCTFLNLKVSMSASIETIATILLIMYSYGGDGRRCCEGSLAQEVHN